MEELQLSLESIDSNKKQNDAQTPSTKEDKRKKGLIKQYDYNSQLDQYNVKLCGVVFDAIGAPDFFIQNDVLNNQFDISE
ncbi:unnamed protein product [Paramecium sonneborni]|uniref:Uncharacterized protein n=1 Tax=Paramecium sonneborni TaxID=65129 RepID=A0A8S1RDH9_9CILI|nr:unnamed protein product [Paramecium sonneborni]